MRRAASVGLTAAVLLTLAAAPAWADPAKPSNYVSELVTAPAGVVAEVQGGDSFLVVEAPAGTTVMVPGYSSDGSDFADWEELEEYLRVLPDGTVQLNRRSAAYYQNAARYGASPEGAVGPDVPPDWETVADDGRVAWHDHRIHWMSPTPPDRVDTGGGRQDVQDYAVPIVVDGGLEVAEGDLDWVPDPSPLPVLLVALVGLVGGLLLARRSLLLAAVAALVTGGTTTALLVATSVGRAAGFEVATPPVALVAVGAVVPLLGAGVGSLREGQRRGLVVLGGLALLVFGLLSTGLLDALLGGGDLGEGGFGNWWLRPTLPVDVLPGLLRFAIVAGTGVGAALVVATAAEALAVPGGLDGLDGTGDTDAVGPDDGDHGADGTVAPDAGAAGGPADVRTT